MSYYVIVYFLWLKSRVWALLFHRSNQRVVRMPCMVIDAVYCDKCEMWLNGPTQWEDHQIGKKHKKHCRSGPARSATRPRRARRDRGIVILSKGTALLIEQEALLKDALSTYMLSLYGQAAFRSRLWIIVPRDVDLFNCWRTSFEVWTCQPWAFTRWCATL